MEALQLSGCGEEVKHCKELRLINQQQRAQNLFRFWRTVVLQWYPTQWYRAWFWAADSESVPVSFCLQVQGTRLSRRWRCWSSTESSPDTSSSSASFPHLMVRHPHHHHRSQFTSVYPPALMARPQPPLYPCSCSVVTFRQDTAANNAAKWHCRFAQQFRLQCFLNWWPKAANYFQIGPQLGQISH